MKKQSKILVVVLSLALLIGSVVGVAVSAADTTYAVSVVGGEYDGTGYKNLKSAVDTVNKDGSADGVRIVLNQDAVLYSTYILNVTRKTGPITIDLNGYTITSSVDNQITLTADYVNGAYTGAGESTVIYGGAITVNEAGVDLTIEGNGGSITSNKTTSGIFYMSENAEGSSLKVNNLTAKIDLAYNKGQAVSSALIAARNGTVEVDNCYLTTGASRTSVILHSGNAVMRFYNSRIENYNGSHYHTSLIKAQDVATKDTNELSFENCSIYAGSVMIKGHQTIGNIASSKDSNATSCLENRKTFVNDGDTLPSYKNTNIKFENCKIEQCDKDNTANWNSSGAIGSYLTHNPAYHNYVIDGCDISFGWIGFNIGATSSISIENTRMYLTGFGDICQKADAYFILRVPVKNENNVFEYNPNMSYNGDLQTPVKKGGITGVAKVITTVNDQSVSDTSVKASVRNEDKYVSEFNDIGSYLLYTDAYAAFRNAKHGDVINLYSDAVAVEINTAMTVNTNGNRFTYFSNTYKATVSDDGKTVTFTTAKPAEKTAEDVVNEYVDADGKKTTENLGRLTVGSYLIYNSEKISLGGYSTSSGVVITGITRDGGSVDEDMVIKSSVLDDYKITYEVTSEDRGWMILTKGYTENTGLYASGDAYSDLADIINGKHAYNLPNGYTIKFFRDYGKDEVTTLVFRYSLYEEDARYYVDLNGHTLTDDEIYQFLLDPIKAIVEVNPDGTEDVHALAVSNGVAAYPSAAIATATGTEVDGVLKAATTKPAHLYIYTSKPGGAIISTAAANTSAAIAQNHGQVSGAYKLTGSDGKSLQISPIKSYMYIGMEGMPTLTLKTTVNLPYSGNNNSYLYYENVYAEGEGSTFKTYMTAALYLPQGFNYVSNSTFVAKAGASVLSSAANTETMQFTNSTFVSTSETPVALFNQFGNRMRFNNTGVYFNGCQFYNVYLAAKSLANNTKENNMTVPHGPTPFVDNDTTKPRMSAIFDDRCLFNTEYKGDGIGITKIDGLYWAVLDPAAYDYGNADNKYASVIAPIDLYNGAVLWNNDFTDPRSGKTYKMTYTTALNGDVKDVTFVLGSQTYAYKYKLGGSPSFTYEATSGKVYREIVAYDKAITKVTESVIYTLTARYVPNVSLLQNLSLYSDFKYNVYIPRYIEDGDVANYIVSVVLGNSVYTKENLKAVTIGGVEYYVFAEVGIASNQTENSINLTLTLTEDGKTIVGEKSLSVAGYLEVALDSTNPAVNLADYRLYQATLNYTKNAYDAFGGSAPLINELWNDYCGEGYQTSPISSGVGSVSGIGLYSAALNLDAAPKFRFYVLSQSADEFIPCFSGDISVSYPYNDTVKVKSLQAGNLRVIKTGEAVEGGYKWYFEVELRAYQFTKDITVTVNGTSGVYNLAAYYNALSDVHKSGETGAVVRALYTYSKAAEAYIEKKNGNMSINYVLGGGALPEGEWEFVANDKDFLLPTPTLEGYAFAGWYTTEDFQTDTCVSKLSAGSTSVTVYAKWNKVLFFHDSNGLTKVTHNSSFTTDPNNTWGIGDDGYFHWHQAASDNGTEHSLRTNFVNALNGSKVFTLEINVATKGAEDAIASTIRIRATDPANPKKVIVLQALTINSNGDVFLGKNTKIGALSNEMQTIRVVADFNTGRFYGYNAQNGTVVSEDMSFGAGIDKDTFYGWMTTHVWQWSSATDTASSLRIQSVGVYDGDALIRSSGAVTTVFSGSQYDYAITYDEDSTAAKTAAESLAIRAEAITGGKPQVYGNTMSRASREFVIGNVGNAISSELYAMVKALASADAENEYFAIKSDGVNVYIVASCDDAYTSALRYIVTSYKADGKVKINDNTDIAVGVSSEDLFVSSLVDDTPHDTYMSYEIADNFFDAYEDPFGVTDEDLLKMTLVRSEEGVYDILYADERGGTYRVSIVHKFWGMWMLGRMEYITAAGVTHTLATAATEYEFVLRCSSVGGNYNEIRSGNHGAFAMDESAWNAEDTTLTNDRFLDMAFYDGKNGDKIELAVGESVTLDGIRMVMHHNVYEDEYCEENVLINVERSYLFNGFEVLQDAKLYAAQDIDFGTTYSACMPIHKNYSDRAKYYHDDGTYSYYMTPNAKDKGVNDYERGIDSSKVDLWGSVNPDYHMIVTLLNPDEMLVLAHNAAGGAVYRNMLGGVQNKVYFTCFSTGGPYTCVWGTELNFKTSWCFTIDEDFVAPDDSECIRVVGPVATAAVVKEEQ